MIHDAHTRSAEELAEAADLYLALGRITRLLRRSGDLGSLSPGAAAALATLVRGGAMRLGDLAAAERVTAPTMSRIVTALEKLGYLERFADPVDGRAQLLVATDPARDLVNGLTSARIHRFATALDTIDAEDRKVLTRALTRLVELLDEQPDNPGGSRRV
ncbi:MarR family winged helix-turn-helix transcriptional regulator [Nocardia sp. NPDC003482]|uniref:MarR family winged helix-turn-helix transcriptional regulator n=1 Tax=Nocardia sp. NPDC004068 TaxID=3364303 RepID=UPI0036862B14